MEKCSKLWILSRNGRDRDTLSRCALVVHEPKFCVLCFTTEDKARRYNDSELSYHRIYEPHRYGVDQILESAKARGFGVVTDAKSA